MRNNLLEKSNTYRRVARVFRNSFLACVLATGMGLPVLAQSQGLCESHPIENRFTGLGGEHSSITKGTVIRSVPHLQEMFARYEADLRKVMSEQGMGNVADDLFSTVASGEGISEMTVNPGDSFEWMAFRRKGEAVSVAPVCMKTEKTYDSYRINVPVSNGTTTEVYEFVAPKVCLNLAYVGKRAMAECRIEAPAKAKAGEPFEIAMNGTQYNASLTVENEQGEVVKTTSPPFPRQVTLEEPGVYTLKGAVTNEAGDTSRCEASVVMEQTTAWTVRPFALSMNTSDDQIVNRSPRSRAANGANSDFLQTTFQTHSGFGGGVGVEYHLNDNWGIESRLLMAFPEARLNADTTTQWLHDTDDMEIAQLTVGPNYHFYRNDRVDLFAGPYLGFTSPSDVSLSVEALDVRQERSFEDEFIVGGQLGADVKVIENSPWKLHLGVMYSDLTAEDERTGEKVDIDPWLFLGGVARDF